MSHDEFKKLDTPDGLHLEPCPVCAAVAELWRRSDSPSSPTETAVCCSNGDTIGPQDSSVNAGCLLFMPPDEFYRGTIRDAVKWWNEYAKALDAQKRARRELRAAAQPTAQATQASASGAHAGADDARAAAVGAADMADALSCIRWMYRRLPQAYGRLPSVEKCMKALAAEVGQDVADDLKERAERVEEHLEEGARAAAKGAAMEAAPKGGA